MIVGFQVIHEDHRVSVTPGKTMKARLQQQAGLWAVACDWRSVVPYLVVDELGKVWHRHTLLSQHGVASTSDVS